MKPPELIESFRYEGAQELAFELRALCDSKRQFSVVFDFDGSAIVSAPKVGHRKPAHPQPTPPQRKAA